MPNTTTYNFGDIVLVPVPFTDQSASKKRPAVIVRSAAYHRCHAGSERLVDLLRADEMNVGIDAAGGDNRTLAGDDFRRRTDDDIGLILRTLGALQGADVQSLRSALRQILE